MQSEREDRLWAAPFFGTEKVPWDSPMVLLFRGARGRQGRKEGPPTCAGNIAMALYATILYFMIVPPDLLLKKQFLILKFIKSARPGPAGGLPPLDRARGGQPNARGRPPSKFYLDLAWRKSGRAITEKHNMYCCTVRTVDHPRLRVGTVEHPRA